MPDSETFVALVSSSRRERRFWENSVLPALKTQVGFTEVYHLPLYSLASARDDRSFLHSLLQRRQRQTEALAKALQRPPFCSHHPEDDPDVTLVALGRGCLLVQDFLLRCLMKDTDVRQIRRVRQVVFLTPPRPPHWIAWAFAAIFVLATLSVPLYFLWPNKVLLAGIASALVGLVTIASGVLAIATSSTALDVLGMASERFLGAWTHREFEKRINSGSKRMAGAWPIPKQEIWPHRLRHAESGAIEEICEAILTPIGHPNTYEVDLFEYTLTVEPVPVKALPREVRDRLTIKEKYTGVANFVSHVRFAGHDRTWGEGAPKADGELPPWELRYATRGYLEVHDPCPDNLATSGENFAKHSAYICRFRPKPNEDRFLRVTLYGGYDAGNRDSHIHLRADANYRLVRGNLDLSSYLRRGWSISPPKSLFFHSRIPSTRSSDQRGSLERDLKDLECDCLTNKRVLGVDLEVKQVSAGVFQWEKPNVRNGGIIAFEFDVIPPTETKEVNAAKARSIK